MLNPGAVFTPAISLSKTFLVSNNISFKGKKDLSTNASVQVSPISSILTPIPPRGGSGRSQPRTGTPAGRRRTEPPPQRPAEGSDRRDSDRSRPRRGSQPRRAVPAKTSQFPGCGHRSTGGRTDGRTGGDTGTGCRAHMQMGPVVLIPDLGPKGVQVARRGRRAPGTGDTGAAAGGQPRRASSRRAGAPARAPRPAAAAAAAGGGEG